MNPSLVAYLEENKNTYSQADLIAALKQAGHAEADIAEAVALVYDTPTTRSDESVPLLDTGKTGAKGHNAFWRGVTHTYVTLIVVSIFGPIAYVVYRLFAAPLSPVHWKNIGLIVAAFVSTFTVVWFIGIFLSLVIRRDGKGAYVGGIIVAMLLSLLCGFGSCFLLVVSSLNLSGID